MRREVKDYVTCAAHQKLQEKKSGQHDLQSRSSMSTKVSPTLSAETIKEEISCLILIFLVQTMHRCNGDSHRILILCRFNRYHFIVSLSDQFLPRNYSRFTWSQFYVKPLPLVRITSNNTRSRGGAA